MCRHQPHLTPGQRKLDLSKRTGVSSSQEHELALINSSELGFSKSLNPEITCEILHEWALLSKALAFIRFSKGCMIQNKEFRKETNQCGLDIVELGLERKQGW